MDAPIDRDAMQWADVPVVSDSGLGFCAWRS